MYTYLALKGWLDTTQIVVHDGVLRIGRCGDISGPDGRVNLSDITSLVDFVYVGGEAPPSLWAANVDGSIDGAINLGDITDLIGFVYLDGPDLHCP